MRAIQIAAVRDRICYIGATHDLIATEEGQNGCKDGQRIVTVCLTGTGEVPIIPPLSLSNGVSTCSPLVSYRLRLGLVYSCLLELDLGPQVSTQRSETRCHQGHCNCINSSLWVLSSAVICPETDYRQE